MEMQQNNVVPNGNFSRETALEWVKNAPSMMRPRLSEQPPLRMGHRPVVAAGFAVGAVLAGVSLFKQMSKKWKWATGIGAAVAGAGSWYIGSQGAHVEKAFNFAQGEMQRQVGAFLDVLEKDPALQEKLADALVQNVPGLMSQGLAPDDAAMRTTMEFAISGKHIDPDQIGRKIQAKYGDRLPAGAVIGR